MPVQETPVAITHSSACQYLYFCTSTASKLRQYEMPAQETPFAITYSGPKPTEQVHAKKEKKCDYCPLKRMCFICP